MRARVAGVIIAGVLAAGCGGGSEDATPTTVASTAATTVTTQTTEAPTTTLSQREQDEAEIRALFDRYQTGVVEFRIPVPDPESPVLEELFVDPLLQRAKEALAQSVLYSEEYFGSYEISGVTVLDYSASAAVVEICSLDALGVRDSEGNVLIEPDAFFETREYRLVRIESGWRVQDFFPGDDVECS